MKSYYLQYLAFEVVVFIGIYVLSKDKEIAAWFTLAMSNALTYSAVTSRKAVIERK